jgi:hypothetical protein
MMVILRWLLLGGLITALALVPVGFFLSVFSANYVSGLIGAEHSALLVLGALIIFHLVPVSLFLAAYDKSPRIPRWIGWIMILVAPAAGWQGFDGIIRGDWGDIVLWGPYLVTGVLLAVCGLIIALGQSRA